MATPLEVDLVTVDPDMGSQGIFISASSAPAESATFNSLIYVRPGDENGMDEADEESRRNQDE